MNVIKIYIVTFSLLIFSAQIFADDFEYQKNLIACQHHFSTCDVNLLKRKDSKDIDRTKVELSKQLKEKAKLARINSSSSQAKIGSSSSHSASTGCAENGSCYGDVSVNTGRPKTIAVKGYTRKDGTYVRGHYRSKPKD